MCEDFTSRVSHACRQLLKSQESGFSQIPLMSVHRVRICFSPRGLRKAQRHDDFAGDRKNILSLSCWCEFAEPNLLNSVAALYS